MFPFCVRIKKSHSSTKKKTCKTVKWIENAWITRKIYYSKANYCTYLALDHPDRKNSLLLVDWRTKKKNVIALLTFYAFLSSPTLKAPVSFFSFCYFRLFLSLFCGVSVVVNKLKGKCRYKTKRRAVSSFKFARQKTLSAAFDDCTGVSDSA